MAEVIGVKTNVQELLKKYRIRENKIPNAVKLAINKTGAKLKTDTSKYIREQIAVPKKKVTARLPTFTANIHKLAYTIRAIKRPFHVMDFALRETTGPRKTAKGKKPAGLTFKYSPKKARKTIKGGFIADVRGGSFRGAFKRKGKARLPIEKLVSSGVHDVVKNKGYKTRMKRLAGKDFPEQLTKQLQRDVFK